MPDLQVYADNTDAVADRMVLLVRGLLSRGWSFAAGMPEHWPYPYVLLHKRNDLLLVAPSDLRVAADAPGVWQRMRDGGTSRAMILIGDQPCSDPGVRELLDSPGHDNVAYIEASTGRVELRRRWLYRPDGFNRRRLSRLARPRKGPKVSAAQALERLEADLQTIRQSQEFFARADRAGQFSAPLLTYGLIAACSVVLAAMAVLEGFTAVQSPSPGLLFRWGALFGPAVRDGQWWRLLTCAFLHVGLVHFLFNMIALSIFGRLLERLQGRSRLGTIYLFSIVTGALASLWYHPAIVSAGASGGLFGLMGGIMALAIRHRRDFPPSLRKAIRKWLGTILFYNVLLMAALYHVIDNAAHIGGLLGGLAMGLLITRSPVRAQRIRPLMAAAGVALALATAAAGVWVIGRIPADAPADPEWEARRQIEQVSEAEDVAATLVGSMESLESVVAGLPAQPTDAQIEAVRRQVTALRQGPLASLRKKMDALSAGVEQPRVLLRVLAVRQLAAAGALTLENVESLLGPPVAPPNARDVFVEFEAAREAYGF